MNRYYQNYYWKDGKPYGVGLVSTNTPPPFPISYKIIADPYYKRISIEKYSDEKFLQIVYDSIFLDFRHLRQPEQTAWQREILLESEHEMIHLIRDQNDRAILIEKLYFQSNRCMECQLFSTHQQFISKHHMFYTDLNKPFNGLILFDSEERPVMYKKYRASDDSLEFTDLLEESWDMSCGKGNRWQLSNF